MNMLLQRNWANCKCPIFDGIIYGDGSRIPINIERGIVSDRTYVRLDVSPRDWNKLWVLEGDTFFAALTPHCEIVLRDGSHVECGGGSFGGVGYVALSSKDRDLCWVIFFQDANPFTHLDVQGNHLALINSHAELWEVPIDTPENLRVTPSIHGEHKDAKNSSTLL